MEETPYSNREIRQFFKDSKDQWDRIEAQTMRTNGRVNKLENWRAYTAGAVAILIVIVIPALGFLAIQVFNIAGIINAHHANQQTITTTTTTP